MFLGLFPDAKIIAIGRTAQHAIGYVKSQYLRHPSNGGGTIFSQSFSEKIEASQFNNKTKMNIIEE